MCPYKNIEESRSLDKTPKLNFLLQEFMDDERFYLVCKALFHEEQEVAIGASLALGHKKDLRALPYLLRAVLTMDEKRAEAVMWALGELGDEAALPFLKAALEANFVPKSTLLALGKIGSPSMVLAILACLGDHDESVRLLAVKALSQCQLGHDILLIRKVSQVIKDHLVHETSRRIRLLLLVLINLLDKVLD